MMVMLINLSPCVDVLCTIGRPDTSHPLSPHPEEALGKVQSTCVCGGRYPTHGGTQERVSKPITVNTMCGGITDER